MVDNNQNAKNGKLLATAPTISFLLNQGLQTTQVSLNK